MDPRTGAGLVSVEQAAQQLGISRHTLRTWLRLRRLPFYRCGRRVVLDRADLEHFLRRHRVEAGEEVPSV